MENINFEGKIVKPTATGIYKCPYNCGAAGYPQPKWKSEKGFRKHMTECRKKPSVLQDIIDAAQEKEDKIKDWNDTIEYLKDQILYEIPYKIGWRVEKVNITVESVNP